MFSADDGLMIAYLVLGAAVYFMVQTVFKDEEKRQAGRALGTDRIGLSDGGNIFLKWSRPFFARYIVPIVKDLKLDNSRKVLKRKLAMAGMTDILTPDELLGFKIFLIVGFPALLVFVKYAWDIDVELYMFFLAPIVGYFYPDQIWLRGAIKKRQDDILRSMPFVVDLLALSTEAGLDFMGAMAKVVDKAKKSPLIDEMDTLLKDIKIGSSRAESLRAMAWRINMTEINSFIAVLVSADEMGASIGKILRQQSEQIRHERFMRAEKAGAQASQKVLFPMIMFIMPAIFLMVFGPFFLQFFNSGGGDAGF